MKRVNNCKFKETFPWIWDRFDKIILMKSDKYSKSIKLDELYSISINRHVFQIKDISNQRIFGTITTEALISLNPKSEIVNNFLRSLLSKEVVTNKERFDHICSFAECAGLEYLKRSIKDEIKNFFYPSFNIEIKNSNLIVFIKIGDAGSLSILLSHSGLTLCHEFETDNYGINWVAEDGSVKLTQFYQNLNSILSQEISNKNNEI